MAARPEPSADKVLTGRCCRYFALVPHGFSPLLSASSRKDAVRHRHDLCRSRNVIVWSMDWWRRHSVPVSASSRTQSDDMGLPSEKQPHQRYCQVQCGLSGAGKQASELLSISSLSIRRLQSRALPSYSMPLYYSTFWPFSSPGKLQS